MEKKSVHQFATVQVSSQACIFVKIAKILVFDSDSTSTPVASYRSDLAEPKQTRKIAIACDKHLPGVFSTGSLGRCPHRPLPSRKKSPRQSCLFWRKYRLDWALGTSLTMAAAFAAEKPADADNFYRSNKVTVQAVSFNNQYRMKVAGNLFVPETQAPKTPYPAIIIGHPMGAVKEQSANLYAAKMAERGFVTLSIDLTFWGGSEGRPRNAVSPDLYAEAFSAAVDYLRTLPFVQKDRIGAIGICGSGSFAISAAKIDPRLKAIATISMYDMGAANRHALKKSLTLEQRKKIIEEAALQRDVEFTGGQTKYTSGSVHKITADSNPIEREFYEFYRTPRGEFTPKDSSPLLTTHPTLSSNVKFMNFYPFNDIETISPRPLLFITGENAHSREFSEDAYRRAAEPKELYMVPKAGHVDLYDRVGLIPFDKLEQFFTEYLKK